MEVQLTDFENAARGATLHNTPAELSHAPQTIPHPTPGLKWWGVNRIPDPRTARRGPAPLPSPSSRSCCPALSWPSRCRPPSLPPVTSVFFFVVGCQNNPDGPVFCKMGELAPRSSLFTQSGERGYLGKPREPKRTPENGGRVNKGHPPPPENPKGPATCPPGPPKAVGSSTTVIPPLPSPGDPGSARTSPQLNFYIPISLVDENMERAHRRDAVQTQRFCPRGGHLQIPPPSPLPPRDGTLPSPAGPPPRSPTETPSSSNRRIEGHPITWQRSCRAQNTV